MQNRQFHIIAHRGASYQAPENTLAAVNLAWQQNADAVEIDVQLSGDGILVAIHDLDTDRTAGVKKRVNNLMLAELQMLDVGSWKGNIWKNQSIPTLAQILSTVPAGKRVYIEMKGGKELLPVLKEELENSRLEPAQIILIDFDLDNLIRAKKVFPELTFLWNYEYASPLNHDIFETLFPQIIKQAAKSGMDGVNWEKCDFFTRKFIQKALNVGLVTSVWSVNDPGQAQFLKDIGIVGLTTDRPGWIREQLSL